MPESDSPLLTPRKLVESLAARYGVSSEELGVPHTAILTPVYPLFKRLIKLFRAELFEQWSWKSPPFYRFSLRNDDVDDGILVFCPMGASNVAIFLEELAAFGARKAFFLGLAGGVGTHHLPGDLLIPPYAHVGEGTTRYYGNHALTFPDRDLFRCVFDGFREKRRVFQAPVFSTDGLYRETGQMVLKLSAQGVRAIDMETSAFFSVSRAVSVRGVALLWVTDLLREDGWEPHFFDKRLKWSLNTHFKRFRDWLLEARREG